MRDFNAQNLANVAYAFATMYRSDALLFAALAKDRWYVNPQMGKPELMVLLVVDLVVIVVALL